MRSLKGKREVVAPISAPMLPKRLLAMQQCRIGQGKHKDSRHSCGRDSVNTGAEVFNDGASATLDGKDTSNLQDNV